MPRVEPSPPVPADPPHSDLVHRTNGKQKVDPLAVAVARLAARNTAIDGAIIQLDQQIQQHLGEANRLNGIKQALAAEKSENLIAMG